MLYVFVLILGLVGIGVYLLVIFREVPGALDERLGEQEALPSTLGEWIPEATSDATSEEVRETRVWQHASGKYVRQVRYRSPSGEVLRSLPDEPIKRRRIKALH